MAKNTLPAKTTKKDEEPFIPAKKKRSKKWLWVLLVIFLIALVAGGVYYWQARKAKQQQDTLNAQLIQLQKTHDDLQKSHDDLQKQLDTLSKSATPTYDSAALLENIQAAMDSKNTAALGSYMTPTVNVIIAGSGCCGDLTSAQAVSQITDYMKDAQTPWNFAITGTLLSTYKDHFYGTYIKDDTFFGVSKDNKFISFRVNSSGKIDQVFMAANTDLLTQ